MTIAPADLIVGVAKGLAVLESFDMQRQRLNATLAAQRTGLTRAAARRHLLTLAHLGYLESDGSYFWLSPRVLRFSGSYLASARLPRLVQPTLNQLALKLRQPCSVVVLDNDEVVIVARSNTSDVHQLSAYGLHLGARLPALLVREAREPRRASLIKRIAPAHGREIGPAGRAELEVVGAAISVDDKVCAEARGHWLEQDVDPLIGARAAPRLANNPPRGVACRQRALAHQMLAGLQGKVGHLPWRCVDLEQRTIGEAEDLGGVGEGLAPWLHPRNVVRASEFDEWRGRSGRWRHDG